MNLLLLSPEEAAPAVVELSGIRARHICEVLRKAPGDHLRVGVLDGPQGEAEVLAATPEVVRLRCSLDRETEPLPQDTLVLAVPRPRVLARCLSAAASLGFGQILLCRSWRVDKSHLDASVLDAAELRGHLIAGLSQARRTRLPRVQLFRLFRPFVEDELAGLLPAGPRLLAHPGASRELRAHPDLDHPACSLCVGPEGGWIPFELEALQAQGFEPVRTGPHPLKVETALAFVWGQVQALRNPQTQAPR